MSASVKHDNQDDEIDGSTAESKEKSLFNVLNKNSEFQLSDQTINKDELLKDEKITSFMKAPTDVSLKEPLHLLSKVKQKKTLKDDWNLSFNLDDIAINIDSKVSLDMKENEDSTFEAEGLKVVPNRKRGHPRSLALYQVTGTKPELLKNKYNPCGIKSLITADESIEENEDVGSASISATKLHSPVKKKNRTLSIIASIACGLELKDLKLRLTVTNKQAEKIEKDNSVLLEMKKKLQPLIEKKLKGADAYKVWIINNAVLESEEDKRSLTASTENSIKPLCFKQRFEYLRNDDDEFNDSAESDDDSLFDEDEKEKLKKLDFNDKSFEPESVPEEIILEDLNDDENMTDNSYSSHSEEEKPRIKRRRRYNKKSKLPSCTVRVFPPDSDRLIKAETSGSVKMTPIRVGGKIRYFPVSGDNTSKKKTENSYMENKENFYVPTWNDYSSSEAPPVIKARSAYTTKSFSILYPKIARPLRTSCEIKPGTGRTYHQTPSLLDSDDEDDLPDWDIRRVKPKTEDDIKIESDKNNMPEVEDNHVEEYPPPSPPPPPRPQNVKSLKSEREESIDLESLAEEWDVEDGIENEDEEIGIPSNEAEDSFGVEETEIVTNEQEHLDASDPPLATESYPEYITVRSSDNKLFHLPVSLISNLQDFNDVSIIPVNDETTYTPSFSPPVEEKYQTFKSENSPLNSTIPEEKYEAIKMENSPFNSVFPESLVENAQISPNAQITSPRRSLRKSKNPTESSIQHVLSPKRSPRKSYEHEVDNLSIAASSSSEELTQKSPLTSPTRRSMRTAIKINNSQMKAKRLKNEQKSESKDSLLFSPEKIFIMENTTATTNSESVDIIAETNLKSKTKATVDNAPGKMDLTILKPNENQPLANALTQSKATKCSFYFSPKLSSLSRSKSLVASGKPPEKKKNDKPVKFIMKGLFSRAKNSFSK